VDCLFHWSGAVQSCGRAIGGGSSVCRAHPSRTRQGPLAPTRTQTADDLITKATVRRYQRTNQEQSWAGETILLLRLPIEEQRTDTPSGLCASHTFTVPSLLPEATQRHLVPRRHTSLAQCSRQAASSRPVCASHTFTLPSSLPEAMQRPSGAQATLFTLP